MARDGSGTYTAPAGQPVTAGSVISPTTHNTLVSDLSAEITDSLSRSGKGGMTGPLRGPDGSVSAPALSFTSDPDSGLFLDAANNPAMAAGGAKSQEWTSTGTTIPGTATIQTLNVGGIGQFTGVASFLAGLSAGTQKITAVQTPTDATDAANKAYVDAAAAGAAATPRAWGRLQTDGAGAVAVLDGYNVTSAALNGTNGIDVTLTNALANPGNSGAVCNVIGAPGATDILVFAANVTTATNLRIGGLRITTAPVVADIDFNGNVYNLMFAIFGD